MKKQPEDVKQMYLSEVSRLLEQAYESQAIETTVSDQEVSISFKVPRGGVGDVVTSIDKIVP